MIVPFHLHITLKRHISICARQDDEIEHMKRAASLYNRKLGMG